ncbi:putative transporter protein [Halomicronema hongdechloris C2206]|uniref:Transporter protein n=1 Tax=Halomicronema hongdechloris C2206 TaxID=1641165 RepID=A0A1Z3HIV9_9CYAN|nr:AEC family transporter [Halomicronema hongdechloris]ASC70238.1 putative transporter protein [Halomicronema hongdechloris C2206]
MFLTQIYGPIGAAVLLGVGISILLRHPRLPHPRQQPLHQWVPTHLGRFLFYIGVPLSIFAFLRQADLSGAVVLSPLVAWGAMMLGLWCSRCWLGPHRQTWSLPSQGSFSLAAMLGNTGYIGYPVVLLLPQLGPDYFGWALFYDVLGTLFGAYALGVVLAAHFGQGPGHRTRGSNWRQDLGEIGRNPTLMAFGMSLVLRPVPLPQGVESGLQGLAWLMVMLSLLLMGMRLQQLSSWGYLKPAAMVVVIKMLLIPVMVGMVLTVFGVTGPVRLVMVLQAGMPSAFATLVLAETYELDRALTVTCVGIGSICLMATLPLWLWGFATW